MSVVDARKEGTRRTSRMQVLGRLTALIGLPVLLIFTIFSAGVYLGALRSYRVQVLEARFLGLEAPAEFVGQPQPPAVEKSEPEPEQPAPPAPEQPASPQPTSPQPTPPPDPQPTPQPDPQPAPQPSADATLPIARAEPVGAELRKAFESRRVVGVKLLIDPALAVAHEDWLAYVGRLSAATSASFEAWFGVEIQVRGVVMWERQGSEPAAMLADLQAHPREGADVILGFVAGTAPANTQAQTWTGEVHGDHALVFADLGQADRYYRNMLRALAVLLGAEDGAESGIMSSTDMAADAPSIDPENRGRVLFHKQRPFAEPPAADTPKPESEDI